MDLVVHTTPPGRPGAVCIAAAGAVFTGSQGLKSEGLKSEGLKSEGLKSEGLKSEGLKV